MKFSDYLKESQKQDEPEVHHDFEQWQSAVKKAHPDHVDRLKFKGRIEGGKDTISAEIPGHDRSFGVWDHDEGKGYVLKEENSSDHYDWMSCQDHPEAKIKAKEIFDVEMGKAKNSGDRTDIALRMKNLGHEQQQKGSLIGAHLKSMANDYFDRI